MQSKCLREYVEIFLQEKKFKDLKNYQKNKAVNIYQDLMDPENEDLRDEVYDLIDTSYGYLKGGHGSMKDADDLMDPSNNDYTEFLAFDIDSDTEPDVINAMRPKSGKLKLGLSATDGESKSLSFYKEDLIKRLKDGNHFAELSGKAASMAMKAGVPAVTDYETAKNLLGKDVEWHGEHPYFKEPDIYGDSWHEGSLEIEAKKSKQYGPNKEYHGWYKRKLGGGKVVMKMIFGKI